MNSENITDDPDQEINNVTPVVSEAPVIDWEGSIQRGFSFSNTYELMNAADVNMEDPSYCLYDLDNWLAQSISSEQDIVSYKWFTVEVYVHNVIADIMWDT